MDAWYKTGTNRKRNWIIASNGIQFCEQIPSTRESLVGKNEQILPLTLLNLKNTLNFLNLALVALQKSGKHSERNMCATANAPSRSTIRNILRKDLNFTFRKLSVWPEELLLRKVL